MPVNNLFDYNSKEKIIHSSLSGKYKNRWVEENLPFYKHNGQVSAVASTRTFFNVSIDKSKFWILLIIAILGTVIIFSRVFYIQIIKHEHYNQLADSNRIRIKQIPAERGLIYDRFGEQLIENIPSFSLSIVPQDLPKDIFNRERVLSQIAKISNIDKDEIDKLVKKYSASSFQSLTVKDNLDYESSLYLYIQNADLPGIVIEKGTKRLYRVYYANTSSPVFSLAHILGYMSKINEEELNIRSSSSYLPADYIGRAGLEKQYENELRGIYGRKKIEVNSLGREQTVLAEDTPIPGNHLYLTIDLAAQAELESLIIKATEKFGWKKISAIAMNPQNGEIIALVSWPTFNNNDFSGGITQDKYQAYIQDTNQPLFNRVISGSYPSGSTIKPMMVAAALQEGIITKNTTFLSNGGLAVGDWFFRDWKIGGHGLTNATKAIAWSVNTFFYYIGGGYKNFVGLGVDKIIEYLSKFSLGSTTGIDLPGENTGFLPSKEWKEAVKNERWYVGDTYNISIGQGDVLVTPLQVAVWTAAIANGGYIVRPHLMQSVINPVTKEESVNYLQRNRLTNQVGISQANIAVSAQGMRECVVYGSCGYLRSLPFASAGKTGTAQWNSNQEDHAWFTSYAPYVSPKIVVTILVEEGIEGSVAAQPIAYDFLKWWGQKYLK